MANDPYDNPRILRLVSREELQVIKGLPSFFAISLHWDHLNVSLIKDKNSFSHDSQILISMGFTPTEENEALFVR